MIIRAVSGLVQSKPLQVAKKQIIWFEWGQWYNMASQINATSAAKINAAPIDGIAMIPTIAHAHQSIKYTQRTNGVPGYTYDQVISSLGNPGLITLAHKFLQWYRGTPPDHWDVDACWDAYNSMWQNLARACATLGFDGVHYDTESYGFKMGWNNSNGQTGNWGTSFETERGYENYWSWQPWQRMGKDVKFPNTYTWQQYIDKAKQRGYDWMDAMMAVKPDIQILTTHDASYGLHINEYNKTISGHQAREYFIWWEETDLRLAFFIGAQNRCTGTAAKVIWGGENYWLRTLEELEWYLDFRTTWMWGEGAGAGVINNPVANAADKANRHDACRMGHMFQLGYTSNNEGVLRSMHPSELQGPLTSSLRTYPFVQIYFEPREASQSIFQQTSTNANYSAQAWLPAIEAARVAVGI